MDHHPSTLESNCSIDQSSDLRGAQYAASVAGEKNEGIPNVAETGIERVLTRIATRSSQPDLGPPPDGGLQAWTQALMSHLIVFNTWGYIISYGVFQQYFTTALNRPPSDISWVGSVQIFILFFIGTASGRAVDYGLFRATFIVGTFFLLLGVFMTSLSTRYWQLFLAQGICTGLGNGLLFCPSLAVLSTYFSSNRALAIGISASGSATGGLVFPVVVQQLLPQIGFGWTVRVLGFIMLVLQVVAFVFTKPRVPPRKTGPLFEPAAFRELPYTLFAIGMFFSFWGIYFAFYYVGSFGRDILRITDQQSINNLLILNAVGVVGRLVAAHLADHYFGPLNTLVPFVFLSGLLIYCWAAVDSPGGLIGFAVLYGLFAAGIQSMFPATLTSLTTDLRKTGVRMGMIFTVVSFACLTGSPLAGALIQHGTGRYLYAQIFAGTSMMLGCVTLIAARLAKSGKVLRAKV
ncbi:MAG: hypothetical protein Q9182_005206 [Xanthomendoza sp. 2 TL-2023]